MAKRVQLFRVLRREMGPSLEARGFLESPGKFGKDNSILVYERQGSPDDPLWFWFWRNVKASDVDLYSSQFTVEFFRTSDLFNMHDRRIIFYLLDAKELEEMRAIQNRMIARLPDNIPNWEQSHYGWRERERQMVDSPFSPHAHVWMRYRDEDDLLAWTAFLAQILPETLARFQQLMKIPVAERKPFSLSAE